MRHVGECRVCPADHRVHKPGVGWIRRISRFTVPVTDGVVSAWAAGMRYASRPHAGRRRRRAERQVIYRQICDVGGRVIGPQRVIVPAARENRNTPGHTIIIVRMFCDSAPRTVATLYFESSKNAVTLVAGAAAAR